MQQSTDRALPLVFSTVHPAIDARHQTEARNGVLVFMGIRSRRFAILGDTGINEKVSEGFWDEVVHLMIEHFREDEFAEGLVQGILKIGEKLKDFIPYQRDDVNELHLGLAKGI